MSARDLLWAAVGRVTGRAFSGSYRADPMRQRQRLEGLTLYHYPSCPYCVRVFRVLDELGFEIEQKNIRQDPDARRELIAARGRGTVPVLRIRQGSGPDEWMPESLDIVSYLRRRQAA